MSSSDCSSSSVSSSISSLSSDERFSSSDSTDEEAEYQIALLKKKSLLKNAAKKSTNRNLNNLAPASSFSSDNLPSSSGVSTTTLDNEPLNATVEVDINSGGGGGGDNVFDPSGDEIGNPSGSESVNLSVSGGGGDNSELQTFHTYQEFKNEFNNMELSTVTQYIKGNTNGKDFDTNTNLSDYLKTIEKEGDIKINWKSGNANEKLRLVFSGTPFIHLASIEFKCHQGKDEDKKKNNKKKQMKLDKLNPSAVADHSFVKSRFRKQPSKKLNRSVKFIVKKVLFFPSHKVLHENVYNQRKMASKLRGDLMTIKSNSLPINSSFSVECQVAFLTIFPTEQDHAGYHHLGQAAGVVERLDPVVSEKMKELVKSGATTRSEISRRTAEFVQNELQVGDTYLRRRYNPTPKMINNLISKVRTDSMHSKFDQENVMELKKKWEESAHVRFIPKGSIRQVEQLLDEMETGLMNPNASEFVVEESESTPNSKLCLVYQSYNMQRLYRKYGLHLILLDATHKTCKYALPLYFLVVQTNVMYQVVAIIIIEDESTELLSQALMIIKEWNPEVNPKYGMTDFDDAETLALYHVFPGIILFLCDFHREQAWRRWTKKGENNVVMHYEDVMSKFRRIAHAFDPAECDKAIEDLRSWEFFHLVQNYFTNTWLPELKRWSRAYRPDDLFKCNTNNGTESINKMLKYSYLKGIKTHLLSRLMKIMIEDFIPERYEQYVRLNIQYTSMSKYYDESIPNYMVNRPGPLVDDMMKKRGRVTEFMIDSVHPITDSVTKTYRVQSIHLQSNENKIYTVNFGDEENICTCNCGDFRHNRVLCKHFFAIFESGKGNFHEISPVYLHHPYTTIDNYVLGGGVSLVSNIHQHENPEPIPSSSEDHEDANNVLNLAPLPKRKKSDLVNNRRRVLAEIKCLTEQVYLTNTDEGLLEIEEMIKKTRETAAEVLSQQIEGTDSNLVPHTNTQPLVAYPPVPPRRYQQELPLYSNLPADKGKQKHPFGSRFGQTKDMMVKHYKVKVPLPSETLADNSNTIVDGTVDMDVTSQSYFEADEEHDV